MTNVIPLRPNQQPPLALASSATLGFLSWYAEDAARPLPTDEDQLLELLSWTREVRSAMQDLEKRLELAVMEA